MDTFEPAGLGLHQAKFEEAGPTSLTCAIRSRDLFGTGVEINGRTASETRRFPVERLAGPPSCGCP